MTQKVWHNFFEKNVSEILTHLKKKVEIFIKTMKSMANIYVLNFELP